MAQRWAVAANAADALALGTFSVEGSAAVGRHWSVVAGVRWNPWTYRRQVPAWGLNDGWYDGVFKEPTSRQVQDRKQVYAAGVRWWPGSVYAGWWIGGKGQYEEYNRGGVFSRRTEEGDAFGAALSGGYSLALREDWRVDFGLGVWGGWKKYRAFACPSCGKVVDEGGKWFVLPNELILSLVFVF